MPKRIVIIEGHPDSSPARFNAALAQAYGQGAREGGHELRRIQVGELDFPIMRQIEDWSKNAPPPDIMRAQDDIKWAQHLVILYPLWLGDMPALLKGFFEQVARPGFAFSDGGGKLPKPGLKGRSARVIVTMGMPALFYRWYYHAHSLKSLEHNILKFVGISPVRDTVIGMVEGGKAGRERELAMIRNLGRLAL